MTDNVKQFPGGGGAPPPESTPAPEESMTLPPLPPHFWVSGWPWRHDVIPAGKALQVAVSLDRPDPERCPEAFQAVSRFEHDVFLRLNRSEVWTQAIRLMRETNDINTFILEATRRGKAELTAL